MKILIDKAMPHASEIFSKIATVILKDGRSINSHDLVDIDALLIRSVTRINSELLKNANKLKFVGTATAGFDHVDKDLLESKNITFTSAPGNNKESVGDYILSTLLTLISRFNIDVKNKTLAIVGCGNTGSQTEQRAKALGFNIYKYDPPKKDLGDTTCNDDFKQVLDADIISLHVPLIKDGPYKTYHMFKLDELKLLKNDCILINASRGDVIDNDALLYFIENINKDFKVWLDVFENEPHLKNRKLLNYLQGQSAHIAGYSYESKLKATLMLYDALTKCFNIDEKPILKNLKKEVMSITLAKDSIIDLNLITRLVYLVYDVNYDVNLFKNTCVDGVSFDNLRRNYRERHELSTLLIKGITNKNDRNLLKELGFDVE